MTATIESDRIDWRHRAEWLDHDDGQVSCLPLQVRHLSARCLRDLASAIESRDPSNRVRQELDAQGIEELADMLIAGVTPALGWWTRTLQRVRAVQVRELLEVA